MSAPLLIGRSWEINELQEALKSPRSEMIALLGRRRVGKTFLIRQEYEPLFYFSLTGMQSADNALQLSNFAKKLTEYSKADLPVKAPENWRDAFDLLQIFLLRSKQSRKKVIFFDELPWLAPPQSGFLEALGYFWNDWAAQNQVVIVLCGSAASWMIQKVVHHKGSLHNRITRTLHLQPFTLNETSLFFASRNIDLNHYQIIQLYMVTGGIPFYLEEIQKGQSVAQNIDRLCFSDHGLLKDEFDKLYASLYDKPERHVRIIRTLSSKWGGLTRTELVSQTGMTDGGSVTRSLTELEQADFITSIPPFDKKKKETLYRLTDNFSLFYLKFMEGRKKSGEGSFVKLESMQAWKIWCGYAFENICFTHLKPFKAALGIAAVYTEVGSYVRKGTVDQTGAQIDMLIDRSDGIINLCEMKFYDAPFVITKKYAEDLRNKRAALREAAPKKSIFITLVTCFGLQDNTYAKELVQNQILIDQLFE
jgi:AAA+ ATPase superfamily predicted ATPase